MKHKHNATAKDIEWAMNFNFCWNSDLPDDYEQFKAYFQYSVTTPRFRLAKQRFYKNFKRRAKNIAKIEWVMNMLNGADLNERGEKVKMLYKQLRR